MLREAYGQNFVTDYNLHACEKISDGETASNIERVREREGEREKRRKKILTKFLNHRCSESGKL